MKQKSSFLLLLILCAVSVFGQPNPDSEKETSSKPAKDSLSKFDKFNKKAEHLFQILPVPLYSYSSEAGNIFGLAKFNVLNLSKKDTISKPSKLSEVFTISTKGRINASVSTELVFHENKYILLSYINYKQTPEYIFGIGNDVTKADAEQISSSRFKFVATGMILVHKYLYVGIGFDIADYFNIQVDSNSFLIKDKVPGVNGGASVGAGFAAAFDSRDNRYNAFKGAYVLSTILFYPTFLGSAYQFTKFQLDARKYYNPWGKDVIAFQATTSYANGNTPFYELSEMGGDYQMRGYYEGAYRDNVLVDAQVEYRQHIWNIFGAVAWIGTGQVGPNYSALSLDGFHLSYGAGIRIRVDTKHNTNLRFDFGFGPGGINGTYINFAEAF
jgi:hypothetical protein